MTSPILSGAEGGAWTPGPWEAETLADRSPPNVRPWVGRLGESRYAALSCGDTQAEAIANAHLIAAAPELYEALTLALRAMEGTDDALHRAGFMKGVANPAIETARAALSKAKPLSVATQEGGK